MSTRIEGSKLTDREVEKLLSNLAIRPFETCDEQEVAEHGVQIGIVFETASPFDTPCLMAELLTWLDGERDKALLPRC